MIYQIVTLGTPFFKKELVEAFKAYPEIKFKRAGDVVRDYPVLYLYYGKTASSSRYHGDLKLAELARQKQILPIAPSAPEFNQYIPKSIRNLNGFFLNDERSVQVLKNYILAFFGVVNTNRKVFISYKRADSEELAHQLFDALTKLKYKPFLDSYSIQPGVDFQEYLRHELNDTELIVVLNTEHFNESEFTKEEVNISNELRIPILEVKFNPSVRMDVLAMSQVIDSGETISENKHFDDAFINRITLVIEQMRAQSYLFKRKNVLASLNKQFSTFGMALQEAGGFLRCDVTREIYCPLTHIPQSTDLFQTEEFFNGLPLFTTYTKKVIFNGSYCRDDIKRHLNWLNQHLPVKLFSIND
jgi:hypothetical protein